MHNAKEIEGVENQRAAVVKALEFATKVERLMQNPDFREVIMEGFCQDEMVRQADQAGNPALTNDQRDAALICVTGGGHLRRWLKLTLDTAETFREDTLPELDGFLEELRAESTAAADEGEE